MLSRTHPPVRGTVRTWNDDEGWGVVDSHQTPGGCWVHSSAVVVPGHQALVPGTGVELTWVDADQDGYLYRALTARPDDVDPGYQRPTRLQAGEGGEASAHTSATGLSFAVPLGLDVPVDVPVEPPVSGEPEPPRAG